MADREQIAVRLSKAGLEQVRQFAEQETEGNTSMMIRKLLKEAIAARQDRRSTRKRVGSTEYTGSV